MAPKPKDANRKFSELLVGQSVQLQRFDAALRQEALGLLRRLEGELVTAIQKMELEGVSRDTYKRARAEAMLAQTRATISQGYKAVAKVVQGNLEDLATIRSKGIQTAAKAVFKGDLMSVALTPQDIRSITKNLVVDGNPLSEWWSRQAEGLRMNFAREVRQGLAAGETTQDIVRRIRGKDTGARQVVTVKGEKKVLPKFTGGVMDVSTRQAEALVRTSVQAVSNDVLKETYKSNSDVVKGIMLVATLDDRTCQECMPLDGGAWDLATQEPLPESPVQLPYPGDLPLHPNCRCVYSPVTKSWEEMIREAGGTVPKGLKELEQSTRASMTGQVPAKMTYSEWLRDQPKDLQKEVLGAGKFELWDQGKITSVTQLVDQTGNAIPLKELQAKFSLPPLPVPAPVPLPPAPAPLPAPPPPPAPPKEEPKPVVLPDMLTIPPPGLENYPVGSILVMQNGGKVEVLGYRPDGMLYVRTPGETEVWYTSPKGTKKAIPTPPVPAPPPGLTQYPVGAIVEAMGGGTAQVRGYKDGALLVSVPGQKDVWVLPANSVAKVVSGGVAPPKYDPTSFPVGAKVKTDKGQVYLVGGHTLQGKVHVVDAEGFGFDIAPQYLTAVPSKDVVIPPVVPPGGPSAAPPALKTNFVGPEGWDLTKEMPPDFDPKDPDAAFRAQVAEARRAEDGYRKAFADQWRTRRNSALTPRENASINEYVGEGYEEINKALRKNQVSRGLQPTIDAVQEVILRSPPTKFDMVVFRGDSLTMPVGDTTTLRGFISTTTSRGVAIDFASGKDTLYEIKIPAGSRVLAGMNISEQEVLLPHGAKFRVLRKYEVPFKRKVFSANGMDVKEETFMRTVYQLEYLGV